MTLPTQRERIFRGIVTVEVYARFTDGEPEHLPFDVAAEVSDALQDFGRDPMIFMQAAHPSVVQEFTELLEVDRDAA